MSDRPGGAPAPPRTPPGKPLRGYGAWENGRTTLQNDQKRSKTVKNLKTSKNAAAAVPRTAAAVLRTAAAVPRAAGSGGGGSPPPVRIVNYGAHLSERNNTRNGLADVPS